MLFPGFPGFGAESEKGVCFPGVGVIFDKIKFKFDREFVKSFLHPIVQTRNLISLYDTSQTTSRLAKLL